MAMYNVNMATCNDKRIITKQFPSAVQRFTTSLSSFFGFCGLLLWFMYLVFYILQPPCTQEEIQAYLCKCFPTALYSKVKVVSFNDGLEVS